MYKVIDDSQNSLQVEVKDYKSIDSDLIFKIKKSHKQDTLVFIPQNYNFDDLETLKKKKFNDYFVQIGFTCTSSEINEVDAAESTVFEKALVTKEELIDITISTYEKDCLSHWRDYFGEEINKQNDYYLRAIPSTDNSIVIENISTKKIAATSFLFPSKYYTGDDLIQIGWIWVDSDLLDSDRKSVHKMLQIWLKKQNQGLYQAGVHLFNTRSQRFFHNLGFKAKCIHFKQR